MLKTIRAGLVAVILAVSISVGISDTPVYAAPTPQTGSCTGRACWANHTVFRGSWLTNYRYLKNHPKFAQNLRLDLSSDGCSIPKGWPNWIKDEIRPFKKFFRQPCVIHDFGYRNFGPNDSLKVQKKYLTAKQRKTGDTSKELIDQRFRSMMLYKCEKKFDGLQEFGCKAAAQAFFVGVDQFGNKAWANS